MTPDRKPARIQLDRLRATALAVGFAYLLAGCAPQLVFVGDPVLESAYEAESTEREIEAAGSDAGLRTRVVWPEGANLASVDFRAVVAESSAATIALSPFASLFVNELATAFRDRSFIAFGPGPAADRLTRIEFDPLPAMREAGELAAAWLFASGGRSVTLFVAARERGPAALGAAFEAGFELAGGVDLRIERFDTPPSREEVRSRFQSLPGVGEAAIVVALGASSAVVYDLARTEDVRLIVRHLAVREGGEVLASVRDDLASGLKAALADGRPSLVVPSTLEVAPVMEAFR